MTDEQLKIYYQLYTDLWKLVRTYHDTKNDDQWKELTDRAEELVQQYGEDARPIVLDTLELIERRYRK